MSQRRSCKIDEHEDKVAEAPRHHEQMEYFVGTEKFMSRIEKRQFQCIDDAADSIDNSAGKKPEKGRKRKQAPELPDDGQADPSHGDIEYGGEPFRTVYPERFDQYPGQGDAPYSCQKEKSDRAFQGD